MSNSIIALRSLADELETAEARVAALEIELREAKGRVGVLSERLIPDLMEEVGLAEFKTTSGFKVTIKENVGAQPLAANREAVYNWLEENGHSGLIKRTVEFSFGRGEDEAAKSFVAASSRPGRFLRKVEPATLSAFVRSQLEDGVEIPMDVFGVKRLREAIIKKDSQSG